MPTFTFDERVKVVKAMETAGAVACPRCGSAVETHRLRSTQDKLLKRPGKPLYRCSNRACACECTPLSYMTIAPGAAPAVSPGVAPGAATKVAPAAPPARPVPSTPAAGRVVPEGDPA